MGPFTGTNQAEQTCLKAMFPSQYSQSPALDENTASNSYAPDRNFNINMDGLRGAFNHNQVHQTS